MRLLELEPGMAPALADFGAEHAREGEAGAGSLGSLEAAQRYIRSCLDQAPGPGVEARLPQGRIPSYCYAFVDEDSGSIHGTSRLRPRLSGRFLTWGGHIGYDVRPSSRGRGIGKAILAATLEKASEMGLPRVLLTCDEANLASARIIESQGGQLESVISLPAEGQAPDGDPQSSERVRRYWIEFANSGRGPLLLGDLPSPSGEPQDGQEDLVDLRGLHPRLLVDESRSAISSRSDHFTWARVGVAQRLEQACKALPASHFLVLKEAYRPPERQRLSYEACLADCRAAAPGLPAQELRRMASRYVAPPDVAGHPTGAALDLCLADREGELFLGTAFNEEPVPSGRRTYLDSLDVSEAAREAKQLLAKTLSGAGFVNYPPEWWHWSYGDPYWAAQTGKPRLYGALEEGELPRGGR